MPAKYYIYRNIHTGTFSLKYKGKVIRHPKSCIIHNVDFKVSVKGQQRVRLEKRKNVHATLAGTHITRENSIGFDLDNFERVFYNPYKNNTFVDSSNNSVYHADEVICFNKQVYIKRNT